MWFSFLTNWHFVTFRFCFFFWFHALHIVINFCIFISHYLQYQPSYSATIVFATLCLSPFNTSYTTWNNKKKERIFCNTWNWHSIDKTSKKILLQFKAIKSQTIFDTANEHFVLNCCCLCKMPMHRIDLRFPF